MAQISESGHGKAWDPFFCYDGLIGIEWKFVDTRH